MTTSTITTEPMWVDSLTPTPNTCSPGASTGTAAPARPPSTTSGATAASAAYLVPRGAGLLNDGTREPEYVTVHPVKDVGGQSTVYLGKGESAGVRLLPDEAERLTRQLLIVAAQRRDAARAEATR